MDPVLFISNALLASIVLSLATCTLKIETDGCATLSRTYVREMCPQIRVSFCDMNLRTVYLAVSCRFRKIEGYSYMITVRKFALFPTVTTILTTVACGHGCRQTH